MKMMPAWLGGPGYGAFSNDPCLSEPQIAQISAWAAAGAPAGDEHDSPAPRQWTSGWSIHNPDMVAKMPKPVEIPANGEAEYTYEIVPTHFTEDKWIETVEERPSSAQPVHHPVVYIRPPEAKWLRHAPVGEPVTASTLTDPEERRPAHQTTSDLRLV